jgi:hypothetical protein
MVSFSFSPIFPYVWKLFVDGRNNNYPTSSW